MLENTASLLGNILRINLVIPILRNAEISLVRKNFNFETLRGDSREKICRCTENPPNAVKKLISGSE